MLTTLAVFTHGLVVEQSGGVVGGGGTSICGCSNNTSFYITRLVFFFFAVDLMLGVAYNTIFRCGVKCFIGS